MQPQSGSVYRFAVETMPFVVDEFPDTRPVLLLLLNESLGLVSGLEMVPTAPSLEQSKEWILSQLRSPQLAGVEPATPGLLLVEDTALYQALRFSLRSSGIKVQQDGSRALLDPLLEELFQGLGRENQRASLVHLLGPEEAEGWLRAALAFCKQRPWEKLQATLELEAPGRPEPYGVLVMGGQGSEYGMILFPNPAAAGLNPAGELDFLVGFSQSEESLLHPEDLQLIQQQRWRRPARGWPHFIFSEEACDEDEAAFFWLLSEVPRLAEQPSEPVQKNGYRLLDPQARQREDWELFENFAEPFKKRGRLNAGRRSLLTALHGYLLQQKAAGQRMDTRLRDCRALAEVLLQEEKQPRDWRDRLRNGEPPQREAFARLVSSAASRWKSLLATWEELGQHLRTQDLYYGPTLPLLLLRAELSRLRRESGWQELLDTSQELAASALDGVSDEELANVSVCWQFWLEELANKYVDLVQAEPEQVAEAILAVEKFVEARA